MLNHVYANSVDELRAGIRRLLEKSYHSSQTRIARVSVILDGVTPLDWLIHRPEGGRIYWSGRDYGIEVAAFGEADCHYSSSATDLQELRSGLGTMLSECEHGVRYYGGIRFDLHHSGEEQWSSFGSWRFVLPRFEVRKNSKGTMLMCNLVIPNDQPQIESILDQVDSLHGSIQGTETNSKSTGHRFRPDFEDWGLMVDSALNAFNHTSLDKVVLAREASVDFSGPLAPVSIIQALKKISPNCFHFLFEPALGEAFLGASPERLFRREGRSIESEAVAGTRPRGASEVDDAKMIDELYSSAKEQREHEFVRISLQEEVTSLAAYVTMDTLPSIMRLTSEIHLVSRLRAIMQQEYTSLDVLEALHPSPAVGGYPSEQALDLIRRKEHFDRGWYAGPVGWLGVNEAEFAVAIRSGLISGSMIRLYSGAGIVRGSTPLDEWHEIGHKIGDLAQVLGLYDSAVQSELQRA
ncbi:MAG: isochorismate synthase [Rhodothermaceae bacterium]|nr:isochorismate synthase [Rhodothermaceae bacterium]MYE63546.1 isochorismate synthase [Rhodothermaceae bacterium]MYJ19704.1 isochorismate synthase [Rhodothermaceae bacterium]